MDSRIMTTSPYSDSYNSLDTAKYKVYEELMQKIIDLRNKQYSIYRDHSILESINEIKSELNLSKNINSDRWSNISLKLKTRFVRTFGDNSMDERTMFIELGIKPPNSSEIRERLLSTTRHAWNNEFHNFALEKIDYIRNLEQSEHKKEMERINKKNEEYERLRVEKERKEQEQLQRAEQQRRQEQQQAQEQYRKEEKQRKQEEYERNRIANEERKKREKEQREQQQIAEQRRRQHELEQQRIKQKAKTRERLEKQKIEAQRQGEIERIQLGKEQLKINEENEKRQYEANERQRQRDFELRKLELELQLKETQLLREREEREMNRASIDSLRDTLKDS